MNNNNDNINMSTILLNLQDQHTPTLLLPLEKKIDSIDSFFSRMSIFKPSVSEAKMCGVKLVLVGAVTSCSRAQLLE